MPTKFLETALLQSSRDLACRPDDLLKPENTFTASSERKGAKIFYPDRLDFLAVNYGFGSVITVRDDRLKAVSEAMKNSGLIHAVELLPLGFATTFETFCFLPAKSDIEPLPCPYATRVLDPEDFSGLYLPEWSNALSEKRVYADKIAVGAYDGDRLIGLAGASQDAEEMLQIGIDVLPGYRKKGIAAALTSALGHEIIGIGKTPFYSCSWNNLASFKNALRSGFKPVWTEISAKYAE